MKLIWALLGKSKAKFDIEEVERKLMQNSNQGKLFLHEFDSQHSLAMQEFALAFSEADIWGGSQEVSA